MDEDCKVYGQKKTVLLITLFKCINEIAKSDH